MAKSNKASVNTDQEIYREIPGDFYSSSISITRDKDIQIHKGGRVIELPLKKWFELGEYYVQTVEFDREMRIRRGINNGKE